MAILATDQFDARILDLVNQERLKAGLNALELSGNLDSAADLHSEQMANQDFFSHDNPRTGSTGVNRIENAGFTNWTAYGENIAAGQVSPEAVMTAWMNSTGHRANILSPNFTYLGVGYHYLSNDTGNTNYTHYWTQNFGRGPNFGTYKAQTDGANNGTNPNGVITGTNGADILLGTSGSDSLKGLAGNDTIKAFGGSDTLEGGTGYDLLVGGEGRDVLIGHQGNDVLRGGAGNDRLLGVNENTSSTWVGQNETDTLIGNLGSDTFVLGKNGKVFYNDGNASSQGTRDYALIKDFRVGQGDRIELVGQASDYVLGQSNAALPSGTKIYLNSNSGPDELIGITQNVTINAVNSSAFRFV